MYKSIDIMSYKIYSDSLNNIQLTSKKTIINTINAHSYIIAKSDLYFQEALHASDVLLPDGSGIVLATQLCHNQSIKKKSGNDLHEYLLKLLNKEHASCFYMGSSSDTLDKIKERIKRECPDVRAGFYSPPYKENYSDEENQAILEAIKDFKPDVLFVGMTAPKQEKWLHKNKADLDVKIAASIGAVFDFYAGNSKRPHSIFVILHLEWLGRLLQEPKRLWKRNLSIPLFLKDLFVCKYIRKTK